MFKNHEMKLLLIHLLCCLANCLMCWPHLTIHNSSVSWWMLAMLGRELSSSRWVLMMWNTQCYFSKKFNAAQLKNSTIEKEALALVLAIQHFEVYLSSCYSIFVYCDHNPLIFLNSMHNFNQRLMRWRFILAAIRP